MQYSKLPWRRSNQRYRGHDSADRNRMFFPDLAIYDGLVPMTDLIPVLTIDGPSGVGKGTVSRIVANRLGWHYLDSGALYRAIAVVARQRQLASTDEQALAICAQYMDICFIYQENGDDPRVIVDDHDVTETLRLEEIGALASSIAAFPGVRDALKARQRAFRQRPGLVADGRDMGTVIFPDADCKIFLIASAEERARRRYKQLKGKGVSVTFANLLQEISARDVRDAGRAVAPLRPAEGAAVIDTTSLDIETVVAQVLARIMTSIGRS